VKRRPRLTHNWFPPLPTPDKSPCTSGRLKVVGWVDTLGGWVAKSGGWVAKSGGLVAKSGGWVAKLGDGWLS
jgi:hypothetical protein